MTKQVQRRRGTATQHTSFTGAEGELSVNTTNKSVHVHDNVTAGGFEAARADMDNVTSSSILTAAGITATNAELNYVDGVTSNIQTQLDGKAGTASPTFTGTLTTANLTATGTTTLAGASTSADITFGDNDKAVFGAGSDLQIYHDGSNSFISDQGTGNIILDADDSFQVKRGANTSAVFDTNAEVALYYDNAPKLATTSTGVDITGVLTSDGLTVDGAAVVNGANMNIDNGYGYTWGSNAVQIYSDGNYMRFRTLSTDRIQINNNGDISFYEDTGTTPKFFWDASDEQLMLGTTTDTNSVDSSLILQGGGANAYGKIFIANENTSLGSTDAIGFVGFGDANKLPSSFIGVYADGAWTSGSSQPSRFSISTTASGSSSATERMRLDSSGNVALSNGAYIGTLSSTHSLSIQGGAGAPGGKITLYGGTGSNRIDFLIGASEAMRISSDGSCRWTPDGSNPDMTLDASGNLLVGKTVNNTFNEGFVAKAAGGANITSNGATTLDLNLRASDGDIVVFRKDNAPVGSIGTLNASEFGISSSNDLVLTQNTTTQRNLLFRDSFFGPFGSDNGALDLGRDGSKFRDLHLSGSIEIENGTGNVGVGKQALNSNTANNNTAVGYQALYNNTTGTFNTVLGLKAGYANINGSENVLIGHEAGRDGTALSASTMIGRMAGRTATGASNTFLGHECGILVSSGAKNTIIGRYNGNQGGLDIRNSSNNIVLSDGDGNPRIDINSNGTVFFGRNSNGNNTFQHYRAASTAGFAIIEGKSDNHGTNTTAYYFRADGGLANYSANNSNLSDERVKTDIVDAPDYLDKLCQIPVRTFKYSNEADATDNVGVIAQEVEAIIPELVDTSGWGDQVPDDGVPLKAVYDTDMQYVMMKCIQEQQAIITALEARITALENA